jgi:hypothetical protein
MDALSPNLLNCEAIATLCCARRLPTSVIADFLRTIDWIATAALSSSSGIGTIVVIILARLHLS